MTREDQSTLLVLALMALPQTIKTTLTAHSAGPCARPRVFYPGSHSSNNHSFRMWSHFQGAYKAFGDREEAKEQAMLSGPLLAPLV